MTTHVQDVKRAAGIFKALAHPGRLEVACLLMSGRYTTQKELVEELGWPQSTVARHIGALRAQGLVAARRAGSEVHLELARPVAENLLDAVCEWVHPETGESFGGRIASEREVVGHEA